MKNSRIKETRKGILRRWFRHLLRTGSIRGFNKFTVTNTNPNEKIKIVNK